MQALNFLTFAQALIALEAGNYIGRYNENVFYEPCFSDDGEFLNIICHFEDDEWNVEAFSIDDVLATDWMIIE